MLNSLILECLIVLFLLLFYRFKEWKYQQGLRLSNKEQEYMLGDQNINYESEAVCDYWAKKMIEIIEGPQVLDKL